ncbi:MAG: peptidoglycan DD-metalloendopeptidase family protein [Dehalococcoidia bacterium]|nr:peptidoglycan DD-metalloendopeptidase family protein [Dehalococcoidia bacterium]
MSNRTNWKRIIGLLTPALVIVALSVSIFWTADSAMAQTITPFRCPGAPLTFPVQDGGHIQWIYRSPSTDPSGPHSGVDFFPGVNAPVAAMGTGVVSRGPDWHSESQTWSVGIDYPSIGLQTYTGHLGSAQVTNGTQVSAGTVIGYTAANDAHVHVSFGTSGYNDQNTDFTASTPHRDPTPFWTPQGNLDFSRGATEQWNWTYAQWCGSTSSAVITSPSPGSTFGGSSVAFTRNNGVGVTGWWLGLGSGTCGAGDIFWNYFSNNSITVNNIPTDGRAICVRLISFINGSWSQYNDYWFSAASPTVTPPAAPTNLSAQALSASQIRFYWQDNSSNESGFYVSRWNGSSWVQIANVGANSTSYTDGGLAGSTTYYYYVCAYNSAGTSCASSYAQATTASSGTTRSTVIVDDQSSGFVRGGPTNYWYQASIGYNSHMYWTYVRQSGVQNWGKWTPPLNGAGNYEVYVYIPANYATTGNAGYRIHHNGVDDVRRPVNQMQYSNVWVSLGTYYFNDASDEYVFIGDETFETSGSRMIGFDAMQFVPR